MRTEVSQALCIVLTTCIIFTSFLTVTEGKCAGPWAIHACWGGNGKRSDPSMDSSLRRQSLFRQLLLRNAPPLFQPSSSRLDDTPLDLPMEESLAEARLEGLNSEYPDYAALAPAPVPTSSHTLSRLSALLKQLRNLEKEREELP